MAPPPEPPLRARDDTAPPNFIADRIEADQRTGKQPGQIVTRFPPEPNGYLHLGHAKSIALNFGLAERFGGLCNLRFDDTNPATEEVEYVDAIQADIRWLGFDWGDRKYFASDYFERLYGYAEELVEKGLAYVDSQSPERIRETRGNYFKRGVDSPYRDRRVAENLQLLRRMKAGEFADGEHVLRAKIDMASPNLNLRDPPIYRIKRFRHHRTADDWCIYPMYDFAHGLSDAIEGITHSICTLEFEDHRPLYEWFLQVLGIENPPQQIEFAKLNVSYTVLGKRKLQQLVKEGHVSGWNDPRMPTLAGMRRRGFTPKAIVSFCERAGVAKRDQVLDLALLEHTLREDLNERCPRAMAVLRPLKVVIENYPAGSVDWFDAANHPEYPDRGQRLLPFSKELYIEQDDFMANAPKNWFRLAPGREVRLRYACLITCREVLKDAEGRVIELRCTWDPESRGGTPADGRKVKGTLHWVSAAHAVSVEVRLYDRLFSAEDPAQDSEEGVPFTAHLNPNSLEVLRDCRVEPSLAAGAPGTLVQFERLGYFCIDSVDSRPGVPVFNRTVSLRDTWAKVVARG